MADTQNLSVSKNDWNGAYVPKHTAKLIKAGIENGTAPFIPQNGQIDSTLIYNANTGFALSAKDMIPVILVKAEKGYESNVVGTKKSFDNAGTQIKADEKGVFYNFKGDDGEFHHSAYFFPEQSAEPGKLNEFAQKNFKNLQNLKGETIKISSPAVTEYLGAYIAACKSGAKVEVSPEIAEKFKANIIAVSENELKRTNAEKNPEIPKLSDLLLNIDKKATEIIKNREKELGIAQKPAQQQEKKHERKQERSQEMCF